MRIAVLGATGMLGQALIKEGKIRGLDLIGISRSNMLQFDVRDIESINSLIETTKPDIIINAVANTNLYDCEKSPGNAYLINARAVGVISELSRKNRIYFIQISTDHYYTGDKDKKHNETARIYLLNEYARTKYAGEMLALTYDNTLVIRTNIVGFRGEQGNSTFLEWVFEVIEKDSPVTLFSDFYTSSISTFQFASALFDFIKRRPTGIFNLACRDVSSKEKFILALVKNLGKKLTNAKIGSISKLTGILRAESLGLDVSKAEHILGYRLPDFNQVIERLVFEYKVRRDSNSL